MTTAPIKLDWSKSSGGAFEAVEPGTYNASIFDVIMKPSSKNIPMFEWTIKLTDEAHNGQRVWDYTSLSQGALFKLRQFLNGLGMSDESITGFVEPEALLAYIRKNFLSKQIVVTLKKEERTDKDGNVQEGQYRNSIAAMSIDSGEVGAQPPLW